ncbi:STAS-like domain-containing protein [Thiocapsa rosea]|uniref:Uncharacterized protein DUF4325 n=1 Tax=Thiocapsa rosea TaxID=69360 RepID=A0A495V602_9GAMM|nr:STAS-like domain-containing protein [Thiocapsa rosea]RKT43238.1 uncharacterized protein DUF4325 [Thiocapsa rosea]
MSIETQRTRLSLRDGIKVNFAGLRAAAVPVREQAAEALAQGREVVFDFAGIEVTQSFVDELIGTLILRHGPSILERLVFKSCSDDARAIIEFVATDRCDQFVSSRSH